jgi:hypothetical protein
MQVIYLSICLSIYSTLIIYLSNAGEEMTDCIQAMNITKAEPRFTSVVTWNSKLDDGKLLKLNKQKEIKNKNSNDIDYNNNKKRVRMHIDPESVYNKGNKNNKSKDKDKANNLYNIIVTEENGDIIEQDNINNNSNKNKKNKM